MRKNIHDYVAGKNKNRFSDVDFHDFIEMSESGLSREEISSELGVPRSYVNKLEDDLRKNY